jgi:hypothetical protein
MPMMENGYMKLSIVPWGAVCPQGCHINLESSRLEETEFISKEMSPHEISSFLDSMFRIL